ncbi:MAG: hypothetical protein ACPIOQ_00435 [Promethearchaeia archaeon]
MRWLCAANPSRFACTNQALPRVANPPRAQNTNHDSRYATRAAATTLCSLPMCALTEGMIVRLIELMWRARKILGFWFGVMGHNQSGPHRRT